RMLRSFDGKARMQLGSRSVLAGDFNGDGVVDVGGPEVWPATGAPNPGSDTFAFGFSLGGILTSIVPAVEPAVKAAAPVAGGSGLTDVALRTTLGHVVRAVWLEVLGPLVATCPWSEEKQRCDGGAADAQPSLVFDLQRVNDEQIVPIAPLSLAEGDRV